MYFYYANESGWFNTVKDTTTFNNSSFRPYKSGDTIYDYSNGMNSVVEHGRATNYLGSNPGGTYLTLTTAYANGSRYGYPFMLTSEYEIQELSSLKLNTAFISGKYRVPDVVLYDYSLYGITVKVPYTYNGEYYRYMAFTTGVDFSKSTGYKNEDLASNYKAVGFINDNVNSLSKHITNWYSEIGKVIDFGDIPTEVPVQVYQFFERNFIKIYPNNFYIKTQDGSAVLGELLESPTLISGTLAVVGNHKTFTVMGSNNEIYTVEWDSQTPDGKQFQGLSFSPNNRVANIAIGIETEFNLVGNVSIYEVYATYRPPATTFEVNLYKNSAEANRVDKTNYLTAVGSLNGVMREGSSITDLSITFEMDTLPQFNYVHVPAFNRYYFVNSIDTIKYRLWRMNLSVDPLMTFKDSILSCSAFIDRNEYEYNANIIDTKMVIEQGVDVEVVEFGNDISPLEADDFWSIIINGYKISPSFVEGES